MSQDIIVHIVHVRVDPEAPCDPGDGPDEFDDVLELTRDIEEDTPEEAGYGHGV